MENKIKLSNYADGSDKGWNKFIDRQNKIYNMYKDKYLFHKAYYNDDTTPMRVCCKSHGFFKASYKELVSPKFKGCPICASKKKLAFKQWWINNKKYSVDEFKKEAIKKHPTIVDIANFKGFNTYVKAKCTIHNQIVKIPNPAILLNEKATPCPICRGSQNHISTQEFIDKASKLHNYRYTYDNTIYAGARKPVIVTCKIHGDFKINRAADHYINGTGCPKCATTGFNPSLPGTVYYIEIDNGEAYKIGITNKDVKSRYCVDDLKKIKILQTWYYEDGTNARKHETYVKQTFRHLRYEHESPLKSCKTSEMFVEDISKLPKFLPDIHT